MRLREKVDDRSIPACQRRYICISFPPRQGVFREMEFLFLKRPGERRLARKAGYKLADWSRGREVLRRVQLLGSSRSDLLRDKGNDRFHKVRIS